MILTKVNYFENKGNSNYWELKDVVLGKQNIIVGLNATGKSRLINIITNLGKILTQKEKKNGNWELEFEDIDESNFKYELHINNLVIDSERIYKNGNLILERRKETGKIYSVIHEKFEEYAPPNDELTLNIRRDLKHYPFLEKIINWAKNLNGYRFSSVQTNFISIPAQPDALFADLSTVPYLLLKAAEDISLKNSIINDLNKIGYSVENVSAKKEIINQSFNEIFLASIKEKDLPCNTEQKNMAQGMYRALSLIVILEHILKENNSRTILIDDLGEGLDFDRSSKLTKLLFEKTKNKDIQLIVTSNDRFLINAVDLKAINYMKRIGPVVSSLNYKNNKELFEKFMLTGLNNFDFLQTNFK